jgi:hypothetical protein
MSGGRRGSKAAAQPAARSDKTAARAAPKSPPQKGKKTGGATDDARQDALAEADMLAEAVADNEEGNSKTPPPASPPPVSKKGDRTVTLELNKEKAECARLQAETERLKKQLDAFCAQEKKRKESEAAEKAPPAKRAVGSGRRSVPQSAAVSRRRLLVCTSISVIDFWLHNHDSIIMTLLF